MAKEKITKGCRGYRSKHRTMQAVIIAVFAVFIIIQLAVRNFTDSQAAKNILTVMAVVSVIPMANVASPFLAAFRHKSLTDEDYREYAAYEKDFTMIYELIVTTREYMIPMDAAAVHPTGVYCYCTNQKLNFPEAEKALNQILKDNRLDPNLKLIKDKATFKKRLESLKPASNYEDDGTTEYAVKVLKAISM